MNVFADLIQMDSDQKHWITPYVLVGGLDRHWPVWPLEATLNQQTKSPTWEAKWRKNYFHYQGIFQLRKKISLLWKKNKKPKKNKKNLYGRTSTNISSHVMFCDCHMPKYLAQYQNLCATGLCRVWDRAACFKTCKDFNFKEPALFCCTVPWQRTCIHGKAAVYLFIFVTS